MWLSLGAAKARRCVRPSRHCLNRMIDVRAALALGVYFMSDAASG
jgi:hypothetical protein